MTWYARLQVLSYNRQVYLNIPTYILYKNRAQATKYRLWHLNSQV